MDDYIDLTDIKSALRITQSGSDAELQRAIAAASRYIDQYCDDYFGTAPATARVFRARDPYTLYTKSFYDVATVVVKTDDDADGVFENTAPSGSWQAEPVEQPANKPYNSISLIAGNRFPGTRSPEYDNLWNAEYRPISRRARVQITAKWGWPEIPIQVSQACLILAISQYKSKDLTGGVSGSTTMATGAFGAKRDILVIPGSVDPVAINLLAGLRTVVVA